MHRLIMLSSTYQLATTEDAAREAVDPLNELRWRFDRRRLDAESIRDSMLAVSGKLDPAAGGTHPFPPRSTWAFSQHISLFRCL